MNDSDPGAGNLCSFGFFVQKCADSICENRVAVRGLLSSRAYD